jgi:flagellar protein FlgJ
VKIDNSYLSNSSDTVKINKQNSNENSFKFELIKAMEENDEESLKRACQDFEAYFLNVVFKEMRNSIPKGDLIPKSMAQQTYEEMLDQEISKEGAKSGSIGLADLMYNQLSMNMKNTYKFPGQSNSTNVTGE